jgi:hypothetical protein
MVGILVIAILSEVWRVPEIRIVAEVDQRSLSLTMPRALRTYFS